MCIGLLTVLASNVDLTRQLLTVMQKEISGCDLILIGGGPVPDLEEHG